MGGTAREEEGDAHLNNVERLEGAGWQWKKRQGREGGLWNAERDDGELTRRQMGRTTGRGGDQAHQSDVECGEGAG